MELLEIGDHILDLVFLVDAGEDHLGPGILAFGFFRYSFSVGSSQVIPEFLLASE